MRIAFAFSVFFLAAILLACSGTPTSVTSTVSDPTSSTSPPKAAEIAPTDAVDPQPATTADAAPSRSASPTKSIEPAPKPVRANASAAVVALATRSLETDRDASQCVPGTGFDLTPGACTFLTEPLEVLSVISKEMVQMTTTKTDRIVFLTNVNTAGMQIDDRFDIGLVEAMKHQEFATLFGAGNTGVVIRKISQYEWDEAVRAAKLILSNRQSVELQAELATLTDKLAALKPDDWKSGTFTTAATFVDANNEVIKLRKEDGTEVIVPLDKLDDASRRRALSRATTVGGWKSRIKQIEKLLAAEK